MAHTNSKMKNIHVAMQILTIHHQSKSRSQNQQQRDYLCYHHRRNIYRGNTILGAEPCNLWIQRKINLRRVKCEKRI